MFERYTESARRALFHARFEVTEIGGTSIEPEHLLVGLLTQPRELIVRLLGPEVSPQQLSAETRARVRETREKVRLAVEIPFNEATKRVLERARDEADGLNDSHIGVEHLLIALLREERSVAASVLGAHGLTVGGVRDRLRRLVEEDPSLAEDPPSTVSHPPSPAEQIAMAVTLLEDVRHEVADEEARASIARICSDLRALRQRLS